MGERAIWTRGGEPFMWAKRHGMGVFRVKASVRREDLAEALWDAVDTKRLLRMSLMTPQLDFYHASASGGPYVDQINRTLRMALNRTADGNCVVCEAFFDDAQAAVKWKLTWR